MGKARQTVFFTAVNLMNKEHKDPYEIDFIVPRLAWYKQKVWKKHQKTVHWVDIQLAQRKGLKFFQTRCNAMPIKIEEEAQTRTERPVGGQESTQLEEIDIDFRIPGLSHAVVKEAEIFRRREALHADLQQNNVYNPFSNNSKAMIREMGNVELFELCETIPKVQCSQCLLYWIQGVIYCTCGHFLVESESRRNFHKLRLDALSIPHYVIKKERPHGVDTVKLQNRKSTI